MSEQIIEPHGGQLKNLIVSAEESAEIKANSAEWPSWDLTARQICDLELLLVGGFSPLETFLGQADYDAVCAGNRLADGTVWPMPIQLDLPEELAESLSPGTNLALRDPEGVMLAALEVSETWKPDLEKEAEQVYGTTDTTHKGVDYLLNSTNPVYVSGTLRGLQLPTHYDSLRLRHSPEEVRAEFSKLAWTKVIAFQTRNPMHKAHFELTIRAIKEHKANILVHPVVGMTKPGDVDHYTRVRCYKALMGHYPAHTAMLSLLPLAMRMAGPREALWHALIRKNYGCSHFIVGRDHAGPGNDAEGNPFYGPYDAQELVTSFEEEAGFKMVPFQFLMWSEDRSKFVQPDQKEEGERVVGISGTELRQRLAEGTDIPDWFTFPEVAEELRRTHPPRSKQGFTVFFTGLSGSGKSTIAQALLSKLLEVGDRPVTLLDGDMVRKNLSSELGFSKEHRNINILRIGYVASEITKNGGIAICAPIAPYDEIRKQVRETISAGGGFLLVHVATPLEVCEERDRKGLYAKARAGIIKEFTGISDPYEEPNDAELVIQTTELSPEEACQKLLLHLESEGYVGSR